MILLVAVTPTNIDDKMVNANAQAELAKNMFEKCQTADAGVRQFVQSADVEFSDLYNIDRTFNNSTLIFFFFAAKANLIEIFFSFWL